MSTNSHPFNRVMNPIKVTGFSVALLALTSCAQCAPGLVGAGAARLTVRNAGALVSITVSFFVIRGIGGQSLAEIERPFIRRMLSRLDARPIRTVALLRCFLWVAPALNYALAMSRLRFREYFLGSALGLLLPMPLMSVFIDQLLELFG